MENIIHSWLFRAFGVFSAITLAACHPGIVGLLGEAAIERSAYPSYAALHEKIPPLPENYMRVYIYRSEVLKGRGATPVVVFDGRYLGRVQKSRVSQTRLRPGTVFIVDTPSERSDVWLYNDDIEREEVERKVSLSSSERRVWFLKWTPDWTFSYLKPVDEAEGNAEIQDLGFTGYVKF